MPSESLGGSDPFPRGGAGVSWPCAGTARRARSRCRGSCAAAYGVAAAPPRTPSAPRRRDRRAWGSGARWAPTRSSSTRTRKALAHHRQDVGARRLVAPLPEGDVDLSDAEKAGELGLGETDLLTQGEQDGHLAWGEVLGTGLPCETRPKCTGVFLRRGLGGALEPCTISSMLLSVDRVNGVAIAPSFRLTAFLPEDVDGSNRGRGDRAAKKGDLGGAASHGEGREAQGARQRSGRPVPLPRRSHAVAGGNAGGRTSGTAWGRARRAARRSTG